MIIHDSVVKLKRGYFLYISVISGPDKEAYKLFSPQYLSYYPTKPYGIGTQINCPNEMILLSTHNIGLYGQRRILKHTKRPISRALHYVPKRFALVAL